MQHDQGHVTHVILGSHPIFGMGEAEHFKFGTHTDHGEYYRVCDRMLPIGVRSVSCDLVNFC